MFSQTLHLSLKKTKSRNDMAKTFCINFFDEKFPQAIFISEILLNEE